jgi:hypothetical protein
MQHPGHWVVLYRHDASHPLSADDAHTILHKFGFLVSAAPAE